MPIPNHVAAASITTLIGLNMLATACGGLDVPNPTGDCEPDGDGSRICYHSPDSDSQYLPDCKAPLVREYWRVFAEDEANSYIIPRPDGGALAEGICDGDDENLADLFGMYKLCKSAESAAEVNVVNAIAHADALAITHALHDRLRFEATGTIVTPFAPKSDQLEICASPHDSAIDGVCQQLDGSIDGESCLDIGIGYDEASAVAMASAMNALYGIE
jgi:hypothetical protein